MAAVCTWLLWIVKQLGITGCAIALILIYFLGLPWLNTVPFIGNLPFFGNIATGYVEQERQAAAAAAKKDMVSLSQLAATKAELLKVQRELDFAQAKTAEAEAQRQAASAALAEQLSTLEGQSDADDDPTVSRWTDYDLERLRASRP